MQNLTKKVRQFLLSEDGPTAVEYAVMLALILVACITIVTSLGTSASATFSTVNTAVGSSPGLFVSDPTKGPPAASNVLIHATFDADTEASYESTLCPAPV